MLFEEKKIVLKNGQEAILRSPAVRDAEALLDALKVCSSETEFIIRSPEECTETVEQEAAFLERINQSPTQVMIACWVDGEAVGNCQVHFSPRMKVRHRGSIAIAIKQKYWGMGIGTAMFEEMIRIAKEWGLSQLELEFIEGNERGRRLYEKMGFRLYGERPDGVRLRDGSMRREYLMMRRL